MSFFFSLFYRVKFGPCMDENKFSSTKHNLRNVWKVIFTWTFSQVIESLIKELLLTLERKIVQRSLIFVWKGFLLAFLYKNDWYVWKWLTSSRWGCWKHDFNHVIFKELFRVSCLSKPCATTHELYIRSNYASYSARI